MGILLSKVKPDNYNLTVVIEDIYGDIVNKSTSIAIKDYTTTNSEVKPTTNYVSLSLQ